MHSGFREVDAVGTSHPEATEMDRAPLANGLGISSSLCLSELYSHNLVGISSSGRVWPSR